MRRSPLKRKSERQLTHDRLHDLWRDVLIAQRGKRCEAAGQGGMRCGSIIQAHHIYSKRTWPALRYDIENGLLCCKGHHMWWVHQAPASETGPWLEQVCGAPRLLRLRLRAAASKGGKQRMDIEAVRLWLEQELERLTGAR